MAPVHFLLGKLSGSDKGRFPGSWIWYLRTAPFRTFPEGFPSSGKFELAVHLQWRDRAGFSKDLHRLPSLQGHMPCTFVTYEVVRALGK
jgi:hypothetical protein